MHKKSLLLSAVLLASSSLIQAQTQLWKPIYGGRKSRPALQQVLQRQQPVTASKGNGVTDRLIGIGIYQGAQLIDSARYKYNSNSRGSQLDNVVINSYIDNGFDAINSVQMPYPLAVSRNAPSIKYDTGYFVFALSLGGTDKYEGFVSRSYTAADLPTTETMRNVVNSQGAVYTFGSRQNFTYNTNGALESARLLNDTSAATTGMYEPSADRYFSYGASGRIQRDSLLDYSTGTLTPYQNIIYTYDVAGNMTSAIYSDWNGSTWQVSSKDLYTYNAANKLVTYINQDVNGNGLSTNYSLDSFRYQGNNITYNASYNWDANTNSWIDGYATSSYYNAQNNLDSQLSGTINASGITPDSRTTYTYTSFGHFDKLKYYVYNGTSYNTTPDQQLNMYYETYNATGVNTVKAVDLGASIYPNPAKDVLNIRFKNAPKSAASVRIYNTAGQLLQSTTMNATATQAPVNNLAAGNYIIEISNAEGAQRLQFVKL